MNRYLVGEIKPTRRFGEMMLLLLHRAILLFVFIYFVAFVQTVTAAESNPAVSVTYHNCNTANVCHAASE